MPVIMFLDSGSNVSFIDSDMAKSVMIPLLTKIKPMMITVANGEKKCTVIQNVKEFKWEMQRAQRKFTFGLRIIEMGIFKNLYS